MISETTLIEILKSTSAWVVTNLFSVERITQYTIIIIGLIVTYFIARIIREKLTLLPIQERVHSVKAIFFRLSQHLAFPLIFILWIFTFEVVYSILDQRHLVLITARGLTIAWLIIRFGSVFIDNPFISRIVASIIWVIAALKMLGYLPATINYLDGITLGTEKDSLSMYDIISSALSVGALIWVAMLVSSMLERIIVNNQHISGSAKALFNKFSKFILISIAFLMGLKIVGINLTTFAVFGGAIGIGIGLGLQKVFSNLIAGVILLMDKSIKPGDTIVMNGQYGKVHLLSSRYVSMITRNGIEQLIPNDELINNSVENWSYSNNNIRLKIAVGIHYKSDVKKAMQLCNDAVNETSRALKKPPPNCLLMNFGDNSVNLEQRFWINDPMNGCSNIKSEIMLKIWDKFHENGIEIPYPQRDLHLRSVDSEIDTSLIPKNKAD
jgi:small-conductance mechanosensitive channel